MVQKKLPKGVRPDEFIKLIKAISQKEKEARIAFLLAYGAGLRISEVCNLKKEDIKVNSIEILNSKGGRDRIVPIPKGWRAWMFGYLPLQKSTRTFERYFKTVAEKAGLPAYYVFHSLRHGFATRLVENGVPMNQVQLLMGHSNISTTSIYTRARPMDALKNYEDLF